MTTRDPAPVERGAVTVLVDTTVLGDGGAGGIGTYVRSLLDALADVPGVRPTVLAADRTETPAGVEVVAVTGRLRAGRPGFHLGFAQRAAAVVRTPRDVLHEPGIYPPLGTRGPWVQSLHDVIPLVDPDPALAALRARLRFLAPWYRRAEVVVAFSRHAADDGIRHLGLDHRRIHVVPHGVGAAFGPDGPVAAAPDGDDRPYVLAVGEYQRRKGWEAAVGVVTALHDAGLPHRLVLAGRVVPERRAQVAELVAAAPAGRVMVPGFVEDLPALYRGAAVVLAPSRAEGFGFTALEAMACARPLVAFANSSVPEVVGDGGVLIADGDVAAMAAATRALLTDPVRAAELGAAGRARAAGFTWAASAAGHAEAYAEAAAS